MLKVVEFTGVVTKIFGVRLLTTAVSKDSLVSGFMAFNNVEIAYGIYSLLTVSLINSYDFVWQFSN